jgi:hypothetical protein
MSNDNEREERIRQMAHRIWESEGRPQGQQERHWRMAQRLIEASEDTADAGGQPLNDPPKE